MHGDAPDAQWAVDATRFVTLTFERRDSLESALYQAVEAACATESVHLSTAEHFFLTKWNVGDGMPAFWDQLHTAVAQVARRTGARTVLTGALGDLIMGNWWDDSGQISGLLRTGRFQGGRRPIARLEQVAADSTRLGSVAAVGAGLVVGRTQFILQGGFDCSPVPGPLGAFGPTQVPLADIDTLPRRPSAGSIFAV